MIRVIVMALIFILTLVAYGHESMNEREDEATSRMIIGIGIEVLIVQSFMLF